MKHGVVIVTGAGRGIGRAVCRRFGQDEAIVVAASRSTEPLAETRRLVEDAGGRCEVHRVDVSKPDEVAGLVDAVVAKHRRIDVLVNNAGVAPLAGIEDLTPELFDEILAVNCRPVYQGCRLVWPVMRDQGGGAIVSISSVASFDPFPGLGAYGASKAWVNLWTKALAEEGRPHGIRVVSVAPGAVETRMLRTAFPGYPEDQTLPPEEVAGVVREAAKTDSKHESGETIVVERRSAGK